MSNQESPEALPREDAPGDVLSVGGGSDMAPADHAEAGTAAPGGPADHADPDAAGNPDAPETVPHAGLRYAVLRLSLLVTVGGVLYLLGVRGWVLLFVAVLASGLLSFFLFVRQREAAARNLEASLAAHSARRHARDDAPHAQPARGTDAP